MLSSEFGKSRQFDLKLGMSRQQVLRNMGAALSGRNLFEFGPEYNYYRQLGLALRFDQPHPDGNLVEIVIAKVPDQD